MLTEDYVVNAVCDYIVARGWVVHQRLTTQQTGIDIVAELPHTGGNC